MSLDLNGLNRMKQMRDLQAADEIAQKAALGWFDTDFSIYGCAFLKNNERHYQISNDINKIYDFIEQGTQNNFCPTNIVTLTEKYPVPIGMKEHVTIEVKKILAKKMQADFPKEFLFFLEELSIIAEENTATEFLKQEQCKLSGCFNEHQLSWFEKQLNYFYLHRKITSANYYEFMLWLSEERKYMLDCITTKGSCEKAFYGVAYIVPSGIKYFINACKEHVYGKQYQLEHQGIFVTPLYSELLYSNQVTIKPAVLKKQFEFHIREYLNDTFIQTCQILCTQNTNIDRNKFEKYLHTIQQNYGSAAKETLQQYGYRWGILYL